MTQHGIGTGTLRRVAEASLSEKPDRNPGDQRQRGDLVISIGHYQFGRSQRGPRIPCSLQDMAFSRRPPPERGIHGARLCPVPRRQDDAGATGHRRQPECTPDAGSADCREQFIARCRTRHVPYRAGSHRATAYRSDMACYPRKGRRPQQWRAAMRGISGEQRDRRQNQGCVLSVRVCSHDPVRHGHHARLSCVTLGDDVTSCHLAHGRRIAGSRKRCRSHPHPP